MIVCFDIGGSAIKGAVAHAPDQILPLERRVTPLDDFNAFIGTLRDVIAEAGEEPDRIAISITGVVDPETQAIKCANIPCIDGRTLTLEARKRTGSRIGQARAQGIEIKRRVRERERTHPPATGGIKTTESPSLSRALQSANSSLIATFIRAISGNW